MTVDSCVALLKKLPAAVSKEHVLPVVKELSTDCAWRVRYMAADRFDQVSFQLIVFLI